jgi:alpha/beta superfamily hydrolase
VASANSISISGVHRLRARRQSGERGAAVVAPPHPLYGGSLDNPVVLAIIDGLRRAGVGTLAFNWRGVEGSEGEATDDLEAAVSDYLAAARVLDDQAPLYAAGYSFGAGTALLSACAEPRFAGVIMLAPPVGMLRAEDLIAVRAPLLIVIGDDDDYAPLPQLHAKLAARPDAALEVIAGADHFFHAGGLPAIAGRVAAQVQRWQLASEQA